MKLKIDNFKNLKKLIYNKYFVSSLINSASSIYTFNQMGIKNSVILNYDTRLNDLCTWHQQLVGESLGKKGKGIMPIVSICPKDNHSLLQLYLDGPKDKFFTFFSSASNKNKKQKQKSIIDAQCEATKNIFKKNKIPFRHFIFSKGDEAELGSIFTFFILETIILSRLMNVNPYDQPAVEQVKIETKKFLS
jgi:glucose-6-phosphate isomerase